MGREKNVFLKKYEKFITGQKRTELSRDSKSNKILHVCTVLFDVDWLKSLEHSRERTPLHSII
jgi:hypothetical protein